MATRPVLRTICRKAGARKAGYVRHGIFVVVADQDKGKAIERCFPLPEIWSIMGWKKWTAERLAACWATAPKEVNLWYTRRGKRWIVDVYPTEAQAWCERIRAYLRNPAGYVNKPVVQKMLPGFSQFVCGTGIN